MIACVGEIIKMKKDFYVVVNKEGTLEKLPKPKMIKRLIVEIRQGMGIFFKSSSEAKAFLFKDDLTGSINIVHNKLSKLSGKEFKKEMRGYKK